MRGFTALLACALAFSSTEARAQALSESECLSAKEECKKAFHSSADGEQFGANSREFFSCMARATSACHGSAVASRAQGSRAQDGSTVSTSLIRRGPVNRIDPVNMREPERVESSAERRGHSAGPARIDEPVDVAVWRRDNCSSDARDDLRRRRVQANRERVRVVGLGGIKGSGVSVAEERSARQSYSEVSRKFNRNHSLCSIEDDAALAAAMGPTRDEGVAAESRAAEGARDAEGASDAGVGYDAKD